jgi:hypothetical protein
MSNLEYTGQTTIPSYHLFHKKNKDVTYEKSK